LSANLFDVTVLVDAGVLFAGAVMELVVMREISENNLRNNQKSDAVIWSEERVARQRANVAGKNRFATDEHRCTRMKNGCSIGVNRCPIGG